MCTVIDYIERPQASFTGNTSDSGANFSKLAQGFKERDEENG
jgi:hypothetical protein